MEKEPFVARDGRATNDIRGFCFGALQSGSQQEQDCDEGQGRAHSASQNDPAAAS